MARRYFASNTDADSVIIISQGGAAVIEYKKLCFQNISGTATAISTTLAAAGSTGGPELLPTDRTFCYVATFPGDPGVEGGAGALTTYTVSTNITTANSNVTLSASVKRINSAGAQQATSSFIAFGTIGTTGTKTITLTSVNLGTFADGDRLVFTLRFVNGAMNSQTFAFQVNSATTFVNAPQFTVRKFTTI